MSQPACPPRDDLSAFVLCHLSDQASEEILDHLDDCRACEETVAALEQTTQAVLPGVAAECSSFPYQDEPECQRVIESLQQEASPVAADLEGQVTPARPLEVLRDFRIIKKIGEGGMGTVYKAVHQRMQRTVALKVLPLHRLSDPKAAARFNREMAVLGQLNHAHIVQAFDAGEHEGQHFLVMEYVDGCNLAELLQQQSPLPIPEVCLLVSQAAEALQYAHEQGFVHRDIKPSNLMLARVTTVGRQSGGMLKVLDLGLARALDPHADDARPAAELTLAGEVFGTIDYMAPEQATDSRQVDIRSDIYSLGATLYKLLTGAAPYAEHAPEPPLKRLMALAQQEPPPIRSKRADIPVSLATIVHRMLAKSPGQRFQAPADVVSALAPFCLGADLGRLLSSASDNAASPVTSGLRGRRPGDRLRMALGGSVAVLLLAIVLVLTTRHGRVEIETPDGQLPHDVKIVVSQQGNEVEMLQVDNQWTAKLANGKYQVALLGGDDQFEVTPTQLQVTRLGKAVLTVTRRTSKIVLETAISSSLTPIRPPVVPPPAAPSPADQAKPFVVVNPEGIVLREHQFANEVLPILQDGEILEIRGNGPFKVGQVARRAGSLHLRAGRGYRPRFVVGFEIPAAAYAFQSAPIPWFQLDDVTLLVEGCDFIGASCFAFQQFQGTGGRWSFDDCRLIQPASTQGVILAFHGEALTVRDSLLAVAAPGGAIASLPGVAQIRFEHNVLMGDTVMGVDAGIPQVIGLKGNTFHTANPLVVSRTANAGEHPFVDAEDNLFVSTSGGMILTYGEVAPLAHPTLTWKGRGNRYLPRRPGLLWHRPVLEGEPASGLESVTAWNEYWKQPDDLTQVASVAFAWDLFHQTDWMTGRKQVAQETAVARQRFPELPKLGPDVTLVGSGTAFDAARNMQNAEKPAALEGGPFVLLRREQVIGSYVSIDRAIQQAQNDDVIEVRSDGPFPAVETGYPINRITIRAANGYRPSFAQFGTNDKTGEWTLEGLHFRGVPGSPTVWCQARKLLNCSCDPVLGDGRIHVMAVPGAEPSLEIENCYFPVALDLGARKVRMENTVANSVGVTSKEVASLDISRSFLWAHESTRSSLGPRAVGLDAPAGGVIRCTDSLIDAEMITSHANFHWQGDRNLYRISGGTGWPSVQLTADTWKSFLTLADWQKHWNGDELSRTDDSRLFRQELWTTE